MHCYENINLFFSQEKQLATYIFYSNEAINKAVDDNYNTAVW